MNDKAMYRRRVAIPFSMPPDDESKLVRYNIRQSMAELSESMTVGHTYALTIRAPEEAPRTDTRMRFIDITIDVWEVETRPVTLMMPEPALQDFKALDIWSLVQAEIRRQWRRLEAPFRRKK